MSKKMNYSSISNIQYFLNNFKKSMDYSYFQQEFINNSLVFVNEHQLPDMWIKTRTPINRNEMYFRSSENRKNNHPRYKHTKSKINYNYQTKDAVFFPCVPLIIPNEEVLNSQGFKLEPISITKLFSKFPEQMQTDNLLEKTWLISFFHEGKFVDYGPMNTYKVFMFLKNTYEILPQKDKDKKNFMVVDVLWDIYYQPDTLLELISEEFEKIKKTSVDLSRSPIMNMPSSSSSLVQIASENTNVDIKPDFLFLKKLEGIRSIQSHFDYSQKENKSLLSNFQNSWQRSSNKFSDIENNKDLFARITKEKKVKNLYHHDKILKVKK